MLDTPRSHSSRQVHIQTLRGPIVGHVRIGPRSRTLDDLNLDARDFVTLHDPKLQTPDWSPGKQPMAISKSTVLFVTEVSDFQPSGDNRSGQYARALMNLRLGEFVVQGFVHVPRGGDPLMRLNQQKRSFIALTSASVVGPSTQFATAFLAVNRSHISAAQRMDEDVPSFATTGTEVGAEP